MRGGVEWSGSVVAVWGRTRVRAALVTCAIWGTLGAGSLTGQTARATSSGQGSSGSSAPYRITDDGRFEFAVRPADDVIRVDGFLDEDAWLTATRVSLPYETNPGNSTPAPVDTHCLVTFDQDNLYFACEAVDPDPEAIRAYVTDRDDTDGHDRIVLTLDPFNDARRGFQFGVSALGVQFDAVFSPNGGGGGDGDRMQGPSAPSWDAIWNSSGRITERGYLIEASIPFRSLRFPSSSGVQTWGFFVTREWPRSDRVETRSMTWNRDNACVLCQANLLTGFSGISSGRNLEMTPTFTSGRTDTRSTVLEGELESGAVVREFGLDGMWGITTDLTLNATLNPDFSQVEADVAQLGVNDRFALFFPEKRPFFLEGADLFSTPVQAFFSRTIADPQLGSKVTGKMGSNAVGAVVTRDAVNRIVVPGELSSQSVTLDGTAVTTVGRFRRDVGGSSTVGALYTGREGDAYFNRVGGVDGFFRLASALTARFQYLHSETEYPETLPLGLDQPSGAFGGDIAKASLQYDTHDWFVDLNGQYVGDGFRADAGFVNQVNIRGMQTMVERNFWGDEGDFYTVLTVTGGGWHNENLEGRLIGEGMWTFFRFRGAKQSELWINPNLRRQFFDGETGRLLQLWFGGSLQPSGMLRVEMSGNVGTDFDYTNGGLGRGFRLSPTVDLRLGRRVHFRLGHTFQRLNTLDGEEIFRAGLSQVRAVYNFSPRSFVRAIIQYRDTHLNPETHEEEVNRSASAVFTQLLFSYKVNPQTVVFLGYTDNRDAFTDQDFVRRPLTQSDRALFLKLGYAFRP